MKFLTDKITSLINGGPTVLPMPMQTSRPYLELDPADLAGPQPLAMTERVLHQIRHSIGSAGAEQGGMLGGRRAGGVITTFQFDRSAARSAVTYSPDATELNRLLHDEWNPAGIDLMGFVHSHPSAYWRPSQGDAVYAERILRAIPAMDRLLLPIVQTSADTGTFRLHPFAANRSRRGVDVEQVPLVISPDRDTEPWNGDVAFDRVRKAYDLRTTAAARLVLVGVGGAAAFAESIARAGVGEFVLIDPDVVELPNIGTQQVYRRDLGRPKVAAIADRILDVNPSARVVGMRCSLDDLDDAALARLVHERLPNSASEAPAQTVLCGFTDDFEAQARVNRLALHLGVPMLAAQVYREGRGVEVSFAIPGITPACGRCVLGPRYRARAAARVPELVTSHGTPYWATERLNALKAEVVLTILHRPGLPAGPAELGHPGRQRYEDLLDVIGHRNLVMARLDPGISQTLGLPIFDKVLASADHDRLVTDETVWLPQEPEGPATGFAPCEDCGGTGDLRDRIGTFEDTRVGPEAGWVTTSPNDRPPAEHADGW